MNESNFSNRLDRLCNFAARSRKEIIDKIRSYSHNIATHVIKLLIYSNDSSRTHWSEEIVNWISIVDDLGKSKSLRKEFSPGKIRGLLENECLANDYEIGENIKIVVSKHDDIPRNKINLIEYNLDDFGYSLDFIYNQFEEYFNKEMTLKELKVRLQYSFLYDYILSESELESKRHEWKKHI